MSKFTRLCPKCGKILIYKHKSSYTKAVFESSVCKFCAKRPATISDEKARQILLLNEQGETNREIGRQLQVSWLTIKKYLDKNNRKSNWCGDEPEMVSESKAKCKVCHNIFSIDEFYFKKNNVCYSYDVCTNSKCRNNRYYENGRRLLGKKVIEDPNILLHRKYKDLKSKCKRDGIPFSISEIDFIQQFQSQNYKCFYTDEKMTLEFNVEPKKNGANRNAVSIDKIIPGKGYVLGNVVFCCNKINFVKRDLSLDEIKLYLHPSFYERITNFINKENKND